MLRKPCFKTTRYLFIRNPKPCKTPIGHTTPAKDSISLYLSDNQKTKKE
ncbi:hypothetical protein HMPREF6745_0905 [Prevotella sp. oral taxon 472 str. F0295]|nr:hypothetical protein HMPREF6745_0905 [Prevotella sp. oral taxon 472 str. F0295]